MIIHTPVVCSCTIFYRFYYSKMPYQFEICANSVSSCLTAQLAGAHRVELCAALPEGGTTPSFGEISLARELLQIKLHVLIRPRAGDFLYNDMEIKSMVRDIEMCRRLGVDGIVIGCLNKSGDVDIHQTKTLIEAAGNMSVTFHRAFDVCKDPHEALEDIIKLGCDRILTSGQQPTAIEGTNLLQSLHKQADDRIILLAGSGVNENNIEKIAKKTGIWEFHFSARTPVESKMEFRKEGVPMGGTIKIDEFSYPFTSADKVKKTIDALNNRK